jgi:hypothetical protein
VVRTFAYFTPPVGIPDDADQCSGACRSSVPACLRVAGVDRLFDLHDGVIEQIESSLPFWAHFSLEYAQYGKINSYVMSLRWELLPGVLG